MLGVFVLSIFVAAPPASAGTNEKSPDRQGIEARTRLQTFLAAYFTWPASRSPNHHVGCVLAGLGPGRQAGCRNVRSRFNMFSRSTCSASQHVQPVNMFGQSTCSA